MSSGIPVFEDELKIPVRQPSYLTIVRFVAEVSPDLGVFGTNTLEAESSCP